MPLPEILKQKLIENAQAVADRKVVVLTKATTKLLLCVRICTVCVFFV